MKFLFYFFLIVQSIIALYLLQPFLLLMVHYIKKVIFPYTSPVKRKPKINKDFDFAAIITAHVDTRFINPLVDSLLKQRYKNYHIYIVADACDISTLSYNDGRITLLKPETDFNAKIKSIGYAVDHFVRNHDALVIFDSDNLVHPDYLDVLNKYFQQGYRAVQTQMLSKNTTTVYSRLDSIGHIYYTFLERKMRMELGLSSHILGLGIAVDCQLYNEIMYKDRLGGFDKKLQADIVKKIPRLAYAEEALVYDEKVDDGKTLEKQRTRWLFTYFHYFKPNMDLFLTGIKRLNFNLIYFGFIVLRPPLIMVLGAGFLFACINLFFAPVYSLIWAGIFLTYIISFILIIITQSKQKGMASALLFIPSFVIRQGKALLKIKQAGKSFLKTEHSKILYIEDVLK
ncbi:MAG TPA: glycosyltransferase [Flavisolibacter sp.]|jgi:cellulose synthase/poly-beta-1,6-N-acetylglucosamine synthase-like glycosyltransferase|nr:glycosyltransferase [Flavisolibacter sp.]